MRATLVEYANDLLSLGVEGLRLDAIKREVSRELKTLVLYARADCLCTYPKRRHRCDGCLEYDEEVEPGTVGGYSGGESS